MAFIDRDDPRATEVGDMLHDCERERRFPDIVALIEYAAAKYNRNPYHMAGIAIQGEVLRLLWTPSPYPWRSVNAEYRARLAGFIRHNKRFVQSLHKKDEPFSLEDKRHRNPGRPRKPRPPRRSLFAGLPLD